MPLPPQPGSGGGFVVMSNYMYACKDVDDDYKKKRGEIPSATKPRGKKTNLHYAAEYGTYEEMAQLAQEEGCDINQLCEVKPSPQDVPICLCFC